MNCHWRRALSLVFNEKGRALNLDRHSNSDLARRRKLAVPQGVAVKNDLYVESAKGSEIFDIEGRRYIDFAAGIGVLNVGHRHPTVIHAIEEQLKRTLHTCFHAVPYAAYIELAEKLNALVSKNHAHKTALFNSGAEAVENAIKVARVFTGKQEVIAFSDSFHGRTLMALTMTGKESPLKTGLGPMVPGVYRVPFPRDIPGASKDAAPSQESISTQQSLNAITSLLASEVSGLAAIIIEPVQGEGGFNIAPPQFLEALRGICDANGALLIVDEIQSGFGRTGKYFAFQHTAVEPDLIAVAKSLGGGLPISALIGRAEIMDAPAIGALGSTYGGNPVSCAAALAVLDIIESEQLLDRAETLGARIQSLLSPLCLEFTAQIVELRRTGAMVALEFTDAEVVAPIVTMARERGLLLITAGRYGQVIRLLPPLVIDWGLVDEAMGVLCACTRQVLLNGPETC